MTNPKDLQHRSDYARTNWYPFNPTDLASECSAMLAAMAEAAEWLTGEFDDN